jgi:hypothetical protein
MHRCGTGVLIIIVVASLVLLTSCLGSSTRGVSSEGVKTVTLTPSGTQSVDVGATQIFAASAIDALGRVVPGVSIHFVVTSGDSNPAPLTINAFGAGCAGTWDSTGLNCSPGSPGIAFVTATANGVSSAQTTVYVHQHINRIQVSRIDVPTPPPFDCFSQGQTWDYQAHAYDINNVDITNSVGPFNWAAQSPSVLTIDNVSGLQKNQIQVTAKTPGISQLFATASSVTSAPLATPFTTCLVSYIRLQAEGVSGNSFTLSSGSKTIKATVVDTQGNVLANPPLTWSSSNPEVASFSNATNTTGSNALTARANAGGTNATASCTPPSCNIGVLPGLPVYASGGNLPIAGQPNGPQAYGVIAANITPTKIPTYSAWAATTQCNNQLNCQSIAFAVAPGTSPVGVGATLSRTPNSMMFNQQGQRIYFGSDQGLMYLDVGASTPTVVPVSAASTPCNVSLCGKVLAISPNGNRVVVSDTISNPHQVYIYNVSSTSAAAIDLVLANPMENAIAAAFSPDEMKVFVLTDAGKVYVYSSVDGVTSFSVGTSATDLAFSADGSFALVSGSPANSATGFATCNGSSVLHGSISGLSSTPMRIAPLPGVHEAEIQQDQSVVTENFLALEPPYLQTLTAQHTTLPLAEGALTCNAPFGYTTLPYTGFTAGTSINLGQGTFSPLYMRVTGNGSGAVIVAKFVPAVLFVDLNQQTTTAVPLVNNGLPLAASASSDGSQVYVAACDAYTNNDPNQCTSGSVHIIDRQNGGDYQQVPYVNFSTNNSMCTVASTVPCFPDMIAIKAQ